MEVGFLVTDFGLQRKRRGEFWRGVNVDGGVRTEL